MESEAKQRMNSSTRYLTFRSAPHKKYHSTLSRAAATYPRSPCPADNSSGLLVGTLSASSWRSGSRLQEPGRKLCSDPFILPYCLRRGPSSSSPTQAPLGKPLTCSRPVGGLPAVSGELTRLSFLGKLPLILPRASGRMGVRNGGAAVIPPYLSPFISPDSPVSSEALLLISRGPRLLRVCTKRKPFALCPTA